MEYVKSILDVLIKNIEWLFSGVGVVFLIWVVNKLSLSNRARLKVRVAETVSFIQIVNNDYIGPNIPLLGITITNLGKNTVFVRQPLVWLSKKVEDTHTFQLLRVNDHLNYPVELSHGQEFRIEIKTEALYDQLLSNLKDKVFIKIQVEDTLGRKYYSRKLTVKRIREFNQINNTR